MRSGQAAEPKARLLLGWRQAGCLQGGYREGGGSLFTWSYVEEVTPREIPVGHKKKIFLNGTLE